MGELSGTSWFLILLSFSVLCILIYVLTFYRQMYQDLKCKLHAIRVGIDLVDNALEDDQVSKKEFSNIIKQLKKIVYELLKIPE